MATYLISREITITRQEGDAADVVVTVPATLSMTGKTARFQVRDSGNRVIINKEDEIAIVGQGITILLDPEDTARHSGRHRWELEVRDANGPITIGRGDFIIVKQLIV